MRLYSAYFQSPFCLEKHSLLGWLRFHSKFNFKFSSRFGFRKSCLWKCCFSDSQAIQILNVNCHLHMETKFSKWLKKWDGISGFWALQKPIRNSPNKQFKICLKFCLLHKHLASLVKLSFIRIVGDDFSDYLSENAFTNSYQFLKFPFYWHLSTLNGNTGLRKLFPKSAKSVQITEIQRYWNVFQWANSLSSHHWIKMCCFRTK